MNSWVENEEMNMKLDELMEKETWIDKEFLHIFYIYLCAVKRLITSKIKVLFT